MSEQHADRATAVRRLLEGFQVSQALHVAATLGIADLLVGGGRTSDELAAATRTHPPTLYRLLRALASVDVLRELEGFRFELTPLGECMRSDVPDSVPRLGRIYRPPVRLAGVGRARAQHSHRRKRLSTRP